jgi:S-formylglutathione hydrolase FrmB
MKHISKGLISWIDGKYKTIKDRKARGITGLSMGGHGALYLAFKHQDVLYGGQYERRSGYTSFSQ